MVHNFQQLSSVLDRPIHNFQQASEALKETLHNFQQVNDALELKSKPATQPSSLADAIARAKAAA